MNKKKWLSVVSTGILAFSSGAPSVLAGAPFVLDLIQSENKVEHSVEDSITLTELVEVVDEDIRQALSGIMVSINEAGSIVLSGSVSTYKLNFSINDESVTVEGEEEFNLIITLNDEIKDDMLSIKISTADETVEEILLPIEELTQLAEVSDTYIEETSESDSEEALEDPEIEETEAEEDLEDNTPEETEPSEEVNESEAVSEEIEEIEEDVDAEVDEIEEVIEDNLVEEEEAASEDELIDLEEDEEPTVSFERDAEVESLLHGEEEVTPVFQTFSLMTLSSTARTHNDGIYTVRSGDTFSAIATSFNLSQAQLREWNGHISNINSLTVGTQVAVTRRGVERMLSAADQQRLYTGGATPVFTTNQGFIDEIAPRAVAISNQEGQQGLWASLMIAQAAHESAYGRSSLASPPYHNLSGIKGNHNGNSVLMWTWEVYNGVRVDVLAGFRHYPSYDASLQDYANLLRRGLSWDRNYYSGTWRSNTNSVWDVLDNGGLRGYATDPNYYVAIRRIINQYNLTQYDNISVEDLAPQVVENVSNSRAVSYSGVLRTGYSIDTMPWGMNGFQRVGRTADHVNSVVNVVREAQNGAYLLIELNGELLGWVDHRAVNTSARRISNGVDISYDVIVQNGGYSIDSLPWGTAGFLRLGNTTQIRGQAARVVQETRNGNYVLLEQNGQLVGWADHRSVRRAIEVQNVANSFPVDYTATIARSGYSLDSLPWGTPGFQRVDRTNNRVGTRVQVTHETGSYALVTVNGTRLGWVDKAALDGIPVRQNYSAASNVNYTAVLRSGYTIDTLPWGVSGHTRISRTQFYAGQTVRVTAQTGSYALIQINGRNLGWVDRRALIR
jgi:flagellum-specific peptidoglycan hydrolase FlgJ